MPEPRLLHHLVDHAADRDGNAPAVTHGGVTLTYRELAAASLRLARWLADRGLQRGDRIAVAAASSAYLPALIYGASRTGVVFTLLHEQVHGTVLEHILDDCEPAMLVSDDPRAARPASLRGISVVGTSDVIAAAVGAGTAAGPSAAEQQTGLPREPLQVDAVCLVYTSGSTSLPKAVVTTHQQAVFVAQAIHAELAYQPDDTVYCPLPLSFDYGLYQLFISSLGGSHVWLGAAAEAGPSLLANLNRARATVLPAVPAIAEALARLLTRNPAAVPPLRLLTNTGAAMPGEPIAELRRLIPALRIQLMFGLTECKRVSIMPPDEDLRRPGACGRPLPGTEVFVVDSEGKRLRPGETGEFVVRGPHVMAGYWRRADDERFRRADGLFPQLHTGDHGWLDEDGYLYFVGRRDDIYKERGFRVSATEVEAAARRVNGVREAAVLPPAGCRPRAVLFAVTALAADEVLRALRRELEDYKIPPRCVVLGALPLTGNGKVDKKVLAARVDRELADAH